ncbi:MAG: AraC family transcriptional regulator [Leptospiraceae bacterium]|nr:AraC family transcriptional regulator [Leptospiraceae bacterium]
MHWVVGQSIFFLSVFAFLSAARGLVGRRQNLANFSITLLRFAGAIIFLYAYLNHEGIYASVHALNHLYVPASWCLAPSMYWLTVAIVEPERPLQKRQLIPYLPATLVLILFFAAPIFPALFEYRPVEYFQNGPARTLDLLVIGGLLYGLVLYGVIGTFVVRELNLDVLRKQGAFRILLAILAGGFIGTIFFLVAYLARQLSWIYFAGSALSFYTMVVWVLGERNPDFHARYGAAIQQARKQSRLEGVDLEDLRGRLADLMDEEVYLEDSLTLSGLAEKAEIRPYQLSEFLNQVEQTSFARYVNGYRVRAACSMLLDEPGASILSVAYRCGFSSKANFNLAFKTEMGMAPREFLRKAGAKS